MALIEVAIPTETGSARDLSWSIQEPAPATNTRITFDTAPNTSETNTAQFEEIRQLAYDSGIRHMNLELIDQELLKHKEITRNYRAMQEPHPRDDDPSWKIEQNQAHDAWLASEFKRGDLLEKQAEHHAHIAKTYNAIEHFIRSNTGRKTKDFEQKTVQAVTRILENTADDISAPVIIDGIIQYMKKHGLYEQIDRIMFPLVAFAERSLRASAVDSQNRPQTVEDMFRLTTRNYIRMVLLTEGSLDTFDLWHKKAVSTTIDTITPSMVDAVFSLYRDVGALQNISAKTQWTRTSGHAVAWYEIPQFRQALDNFFSTPLVTEGGPLEVTQDFFYATAYRTHRPFAYFEQTRCYMLLLSLPGIRDDVLMNILPAGIGLSKFDDTRMLEAIPKAIETNKKNKLYAYINKEAGIRKEPPLFTVPPDTRMAETKTRHFVTEGAAQWIEILEHIGRMAQEGDEIVLSHVRRIAVSNNEDVDSIRSLIGHVLHALKPEDRPIFQNGFYDEAMIVNQFTGRWMAKVDHVVLGTLMRYSKPATPPDAGIIFEANQQIRAAGTMPVTIE